MNSGIIDSFSGEYRWLSNFSPAPVILGTHEFVYPSVEHAYQAAKTLNQDTRNLFLVGTAAQAKKLGRTLVVRSDWESVKLEVMNELLHQKFTVGTYPEKLLSTGNSELIEGNWWGDTFLGVCKGVGENHLGRLIMAIREELHERKVLDTPVR